MYPILRTMIFVPGFRTKFLQKAIDLKCDALILDLEDSVPCLYKEDARVNVQKYLNKRVYNQKIFIRINSIDSGFLSQDLDNILHESVYGLMPSMVRDELDIVYIDKLLTQLEHDRGFPHNHFKLCPLIETVSALINAYEIAKSSKRIVGLVFGAEDYLTDLGGLHKKSGSSILMARSMLVMAARSLNLAVLDTPYLNVGDLDGFTKEAEFAREMGFTGQLILHPSQIDVAMNVFTPSLEEVEEAEEIIKKIENSSKSGYGVTLLNGKIVGPPMEKRARDVLEKWNLIKDSQSWW